MTAHKYPPAPKCDALRHELRWTHGMISLQQSYCWLPQTQRPTCSLLETACNMGQKQIHVKGWRTYGRIQTLYCSLEET